MPTTIEAPKERRANRPLYLKRVPTEIWNRMHSNAEEIQVPLQDYLISILSTVEPIRRDIPPTDSKPLAAY